MNPFPWKEAMRFGLGVLRLPPRDFWAMSPRELASAWSAVVGERTGALSRNEMDRLMEQFPDGR